MGWVKLNTDGSMYKAPIKASGGGILRCSNGDWIAGFARKLRNISSTMDELWALRDGLIMAKQLGIVNICIEMDVEFLVYLASNPSVVNLMLEPFLTDCRDLIKTSPNYSVAHVFREANSCVNKLAGWEQSLILISIFCITHWMWRLIYWLERKLALL
ncbi:hypothetical protein SO802_018478 [Lithocarpus litseifolius]|uniref:RNase H type-1 domain-containing protein n=1 Tax=Lithocarpus litseifolius TaxID=425828 RepID=A0AAW2CPB0_9ROSI